MRRLLVANRGEIAVRIFRTCRELGIGTAAVFAPDDRRALHVEQADCATEIPTYLDGVAIVAAARRLGADAIHPGYGFLAESAAFATAVGEAGFTWVGPPAGAIAAGGDKLESKRRAEAAGVPVVPGGDPSTLGFPLLVKAAAGGGGRGMRVVRNQADLGEAIAAARREAAAAFGDATVFYERYLDRPRHVEIQLLADAHGNAVSLGERDCSLQRRHQKLLEESPSPALDEALREAMGSAAVRFAKEIGYTGAGTVEFMLCDGEFFFLELNARIQVEHPVTEAVTGIDLVAEQLRLAAGEPLRLTEPPAPTGHAVEVRLCAEDPRTFLPQTGVIDRLRLPEGVRVDAGVREGDVVGTRYDPLLAKLIAHGTTRVEALATLRRALAETELFGVTTNLPFLRWAVSHPVVTSGETTTAFLDDHPPLSSPPKPVLPAWRGGFRLNLPDARAVTAPDLEATVRGSAPAASDGRLVAPMPGTVIAVHAAPGDRVDALAPLVLLEAMKMETAVVAPHDAVVREVLVAPGDAIAAGTVLVELDYDGG